MEAGLKLGKQEQASGVKSLIAHQQNKHIINPFFLKNEEWSSTDYVNEVMIPDTCQSVHYSVVDKILMQETLT